MGSDFFAQAAFKPVVEELSDGAGVDVQNLCLNLSEDELRRTENAQVALYSCGVLAFTALTKARVAPSVTAGHSVGEYAALTAAGVLSAREGAWLVRQRGLLMASAGQDRPGRMAAVLGLDYEPIEQLCQQASTPNSVVVVANDNCPGQIVVSGDADAVARFTELATGAGARKVMPLNVSGAFHSPLMADSAKRFAEKLAQVTFSEPICPVVVNVTASQATVGWADLLEQQLVSRVRWRESVGTMLSEGVTQFIECGAGEVLCGLVKRIEPTAARLAVGNMAQVEAARTAVLTPQGL